MPESDLGTCPAPGTACEPLPDPDGTRYSQTWTWDGTTWSEQHPTRAPQNRRVVATPGVDAAPTVFSPDGLTWTWTGSDWHEGGSHGIAPALGGHAVYDAHDADVVAYAPRFATATATYETWTWNGTWTVRAEAVPTSPTPPPTSGLATALDPLPAGALMLEALGGTINAIDATGKVVKTLVTVAAGQTIVNAQLLSDHHTLWYATKAIDNQACPDIMKLDLQTNIRTIAGQADDFSITPDGSELLLVRPASKTAVTNDCRQVPYPSGTQIYDAAFVMRNLSTGVQNTLPLNAYPSSGTGDTTGHVLIVQTPNVLIASDCDSNTCTSHSYSVPMHGDGLITAGDAGRMCSCATLVSGPDGIYGVGNQTTFIIDGVTGTGTYHDVFHYDADHIDGPGAVIAQSTDGALSSSIAPTPDGVFVLGAPTGTQTTNLYRVDNGALTVVGTADGATSTQIFPIPPFN